MVKIRYLFKNITFLNVLLMTALIFLSQYTVLPLLNMHANYTLPAQKKTHKEKEAAQAEHNIPSPSDYVIVAEQNLFHPERIIPPEKKEEAPLPKPEILLYGTLITDDLRVAYVEDLKAPRNSAGRGKRQTAVKKGDTLSGFTVKEIDADKIVMVRGEETMSVSVFDPQKRKTREAVTTASQAPPGKPPSAGQPAAIQPKKPLSVEALTNKEPLPRTRARMTPADERARQFFTK